MQMIFDDLCKSIVDAATRFGINQRIVDWGIGLKYSYVVLESPTHGRRIGLAATPPPEDLNPHDTRTTREVMERARPETICSVR